MKAIFNGALISEDSFQLKPSNRAFAYGDGIFETMLASRGNVKLLPWHLERIKEGLNLLEIDTGQLPEEAKLAQQINRLCYENEINEFSKIKLWIWRSSGGTYAPTQHKPEYLITTRSVTKPRPKNLNKVGFSEKASNQPHLTSAIKTLNALHYVMAGLEKKSKQLEEIIICDKQGNVSECLVSNIFWVKGDNIFTPSLTTGCINGVSRRYLLEVFKNYGTNIQEVSQNKYTLYDADHIFTTNAVGINHIVTLGDKTYLPFHAVEMIYKCFE